MPKIDYLNDNEAKALLNTVKDVRDKAILSLFVDTGIFLNELIELNINSINWKKKILKITKNRKREIPLNDEVYNALVAWSKERPDCKSEALFITMKGEINRVSPRNIDRLIRKYSDDAGIDKNVNAQILRNTFAIRFLKRETSIDRACHILGISSLRGIRRYVKIAKGEIEPEAEELGHLDTRPKVIQQLSKLIPRTPKEAKILKVPAKVGESDITIGRDSIISKIKENLRKGISTLLYSGLGIGKTHILKHIAKEGDYLFINSPAPAKDFLEKICQKYCPDWRDKLPKKTRSSSKEIIDAVVQSLQGKDKKEEKKQVLVIDALDRLKKSDIDLFSILLDHFVILGAADDLPDRLKPVWWKMKRIDLEPLSDESTKALIKHLSEGMVIENHQLLETQIATHASGHPLAIVEMMNQLKGLPRVKDNDVRAIHHEAGERYVEIKNIIFLIWFGALVYRTFSLGTHSFENYILAGLLTAVGVFLRQMIRKF